jgi:2-deoxy-D-gluconate 3-dehydrogenase
MNSFDLSGKIAIVTGGNGGIGLGIARGLVAAGAKLLLVGRNETKGAAAVAEFGADKARFLAVDVTRKSECEAMIAAVQESFGRLDILVNNAGVSIRKAPETYTEDEWRTILETNLSSVFFASQAAHPVMKRAGGGKIINIGSVMSVLAAPYSAPYAASKGGVLQLTKALATAWAAENIQVNAILPGWIDTDMTQTARRVVGGLHEHVLARTPAARWGEPADLAGAAVFLASAASDFVTGAGLPVDGGYMIKA